MANETDICNLALNALGQTIEIASLTERSKEAKQCARHYPLVRDELLAMHPWPFARKAQALAPVAGTPFPGWAYQYALPSDSLRAWRVSAADGIRMAWRELHCSWDARRWSYGAPPIPFELHAGTQGTSIATDLDDAYLLYTSRVTDTTRFGPLFRNALVQLLAARLVMPLAIDLKRLSVIESNAGIALQYAMAEALNEGADDPAATTPSIASRG